MSRPNLPMQPEPTSATEASLLIEQAMRGGDSKTKKYIERLRKQVDNGGAAEVAGGLRAWANS